MLHYYKSSALWYIDNLNMQMGEESWVFTMFTTASGLFGPNNNSLFRAAVCLLQNHSYTLVCTCWKKRKQTVFFVVVVERAGQYLPRRLDTFPQAEVEDEDHHHETQGQLPARQAEVIDAPTLMEVQDTPSAAGYMEDVKSKKTM